MTPNGSDEFSSGLFHGRSSNLAEYYPEFEHASPESVYEEFDHGTDGVAGLRAVPYSRIMRRLTLISAFLATSMACDATAPQVGDTDTDPPIGDTSAPTRMPQGVHIGSEGIVVDPACSLDVVDEDADLDGFERTRAQLAADRLAAVHVELGFATDSLAGTLSFAPTSYALLRGTDCPNEVVIGVSSTLSGLPRVAASPSGWVVFESDTAAFAGLRTGTWTGDAAPSLDPLDYQSIALVLDATLGPAGISGALTFEGCNGAACDTENLASIASTP